MRNVLTVSSAMFMAAFMAACGAGEESVAPDMSEMAEGDAPVIVMMTSLPPPTFHHIHINSVDPEASLDWWKTVWPAGEITTYAGFPAFAATDIYHLYTQVDTQAPGGFDKDLHRAVPQSVFWTTGPSTDGLAFYERLTAHDPEGERFDFLPVYTGPDDTEGVPHSGLAPYGDRLLTVAELEEREGTPPERNPNSQDFGYLVDPDGVLLEFNGNAQTEDNFYGHLHFWHEDPRCAVNWYIEHLGALPPGEPREFEPYDPCVVEFGPVSYPTFIPEGQLRQPNGSVRLANTNWFWYGRQCRFGRCGEGGDQPLSPSRGQVIDHMGLTYPDLDAVMVHLEAKGVVILEGPYDFGDTRAILIEDLDGFGLELIERP